MKSLQSDSAMYIKVCVTHTTHVHTHILHIYTHYTTQIHHAFTTYTTQMHYAYTYNTTHTYPTHTQTNTHPRHSTIMYSITVNYIVVGQLKAVLLLCLPDNFRIKLISQYVIVIFVVTIYCH